MRIWDFSGRAFGICAGAAMLAGCGGSQPPIGAPGAMPQSSGLAAHADRSGSWMEPEAKSKELLYVGTAIGAYVLSYPGGLFQGQINSVSQAVRLCSDQMGNVYILSSLSTPGTISEFAHGGSEPIKTLDDPYGDPWDCAVDPTTGDLAVTNQLGPQESHGNVVIYPNGSGEPQVYSDTNVVSFLFCDYDNQGDLFADAEGTTPFLELPKGAGTFTAISLGKPLVQPVSVQWKGTHIAVADFRASSVYHVKVVGSTGTIVGTTHLRGWTSKTGNVGSWIQGKAILAPTSPKAYKLAIWDYPTGGRPTAVWDFSGEVQLNSVTISVAPH
jgi:hypothetical protein